MLVPADHLALVPNELEAVELRSQAFLRQAHDSLQHSFCILKSLDVAVVGLASGDLRRFKDRGPTKATPK
jgi:hypothetical protein